MSKIFRDSENDKQYHRDGFVLVDLFSEREVEALRAQYHSLAIERKAGFHTTFQNANSERVFALIKAAAEKPLNELFADYRIVTGLYLVKESGEDSAVPIHQDWNLVDESRCASLNVWIPLVDTTFTNGGLHLIKGSHRVGGTVRGTRVPDPCECCLDITLDQMTLVTTRVGQAVVYDSRVLHASPANRSGAERVVCMIAVIPRAAELLHYRFNEREGMLERYAATEQFFLSYNRDAEAPQGAVLKDSVRRSADQFSRLSRVQLAPLLGASKSARD